MPVLWTFRCYVSARGTDVIRDWYDEQPPAVQAKFDSRLKLLAQNERKEWKREPFDLLRREECKGLGEIRFKANRVQHRPLGYFSPGNIFTFVICAEERGRRFVPKKACQIGLGRKAEIEADPEKSHVCRFDLE